MNSFSLKVKFESDWHIGEGAGQQGRVDRLVRRSPQDGLPYVPAKTLTGIWRDSCEQIAEGLGSGWPAWVDLIFGTSADKGQTTPARMALRAAHLDQSLRQDLVHYPRLAEALVWVKPGVALDELGVAKNDFLRFEEMVMAGLELTATGELALEGPELTAAQALLWAGAQATHRIGAKRRRGAGKCRLEAPGLIEPEQALEVLAQNPPTAPQFSPARHVFGSLDLKAGSEWQIVDLVIQLKSPVIATENTLGNVVESRDYLPGTYLLAALNRKLEDLLGGPLLSALAAGQIRFSNAYLEMENQRGLPVPMALFYHKTEASLESVGSAYNRLVKPQEDSAQEKQHRQGYVAPGSDHLLFGKVDIFSTTHGTIEDKLQRPTAAVGGVFTYTALAAGTVLRAQIWLARGWRQLNEAEIAGLSGEYRLGRSKKDDYGWVRIEARPAPPPTPPAAGELLTVWLVSPLLLRSADLASSAAPEELQSYLERELGLELEPGKNFSRLTRLEGFSSPWGLARPSLIGWAGGSCFAFNHHGKLDPAKLARLQFQGLGELRGEGFGEVIFNSPVLSQAVWRRQAPGSPKTTSVPRGSFSHPLMAQRALRSYIEERALELGYSSKFRVEKLGWNEKAPPSSQLGNLRSYLEEGDLKALSEWIQHLQETKNRWDKWEGQAAEALKQLAHNPGEQAWGWLGQVDELPEWVWQEQRQLDTFAVQAVWLSALHAELREREKRAAQEA